MAVKAGFEEIHLKLQRIDNQMKYQNGPSSVQVPDAISEGTMAN